MTDTEYQLGATQSGAQLIRDFLRVDIGTLKRDLEQAAHDHDNMGRSIELLTKHLNELEETTYDLLDKIIKANANMIVTVKDPS